MKIGFNLIQYTDCQGIEVFTQNLLSHFKVRPEDELILFTNQKSQKLFAGLNPAAKISNHNFRRLNRLSLIAYQQVTLPLILKKQKIDLLFCPSLAVPLLWRRKIVTIHDLAFLRFSDESNLFFKIYLKLALLSAKYFSLAIGAISNFSRSEIIQLMKVKPNKIFNISCSAPELIIPSLERRQEILKKFNLLISCNQEAKKKPYFFYIGNAYPRKNLPKTLLAFKLFSTAHPEYLFIFAGKKDERMLALEKLALSSGLKDKTIFPGFISQEEKIALIKEAVGLSLVSTYEGFGIPVLEAQIIGIPVLTANSSSLPEVAGRGAIFVDPHNTQDIATGLEKLAFDETTRQELISQGQKNIARYSWAEASANLETIFQKVIIKNNENSSNK